MMFKKFIFSVLVVILLPMASCNKDEEIIIDNPDSPDVEQTVFKVIEYLPAPGQFINEKASLLDNVNSMEEACIRAQSRLDNNLFVSLGAWGGYIVVEVRDGEIQNSGNYDFSIYGNAFDTSNEPGIVWVMKDENRNGLPDDKWYELKGSYYGKSGYKRNYSVTYYRPENPKENTRWTDSNGKTGTVDWMGTFHSQDFYYPSWVKESSYTLTGSLLPDHSYQDQQTGEWINPPFSWGYSDNEGEDSVIVTVNGKTVQKNLFRISDAINEEGNEINLESINFIKVQTGINGKTVVLGENSTEVCGFAIENE